MFEWLNFSSGKNRKGGGFHNSDKVTSCRKKTKGETLRLPSTVASFLKKWFNEPRIPAKFELTVRPKGGTTTYNNHEKVRMWTLQEN